MINTIIRGQEVFYKVLTAFVLKRNNQCITYNKVMSHNIFKVVIFKLRIGYTHVKTNIMDRHNYVVYSITIICCY